LVRKIILYYDAQSKKHQNTDLKSKTLLYTSFSHDDVPVTGFKVQYIFNNSTI